VSGSGEDGWSRLISVFELTRSGRRDGGSRNEKRSYTQQQLVEEVNRVRERISELEVWEPKLKEAAEALPWPGRGVQRQLIRALMSTLVKKKELCHGIHVRRRHTIGCEEAERL